MQTHSVMLALGVLSGVLAALPGHSQEPSTSPSSGQAAGSASPTPAPATATATEPPPATELAPAPSVLLLKDGRVVQGIILEGQEGYTVRTPVGELPFRAQEVEEAFATIQELFAYKKARTPDQDPDERLKLAQWCLSQKLHDEAKVELEAVLRLSPGLPQARSMLFQIPAMVAAAGQPQSDPGLMRTSAEAPGTGAPRSLPPSVLLELRDEARRNPQSLGLPIIFDLPPQQAVKKYREFAAYVHPALQRTCVQCHNEETSGSFHMIQARAGRDLQNDLLVRANLDAVLPLVNPKDPANSKLLSVAIMPHKPMGRPVLTGPNHPTYRLIATWLNGVKSATWEAPPAASADQQSPLSVAAPAQLAPAADSGVANAGFAVDRSKAGSAGPTPGEAPAPAAAGVAPAQGVEAPHTMILPTGEVTSVQVAPAGQIFPGSETGKPRLVPPPSEFRQSLPGDPAPAGTEAPATPGRKPTVSGGAAAASAGQVIKLPTGEEIPVADLSGPATKAAAAAPAAPGDPAKEQAPPSTPSSTTKQKKLDRSALGKFMLQRRR